MGLGLCLVGVSVLLGISLNSERVYALYLPPALILYVIGHLLCKGKAGSQ